VFELQIEQGQFTGALTVTVAVLELPLRVAVTVTD
jgi:hypothetical protein